MSVRDPPNLRRWVEWGLRRPESKVIKEGFELAPKTVSGDTTTNGQRKGVPNSWSGSREAVRTETCADTGNEQQFRVRRTQGTRWSVMLICSWVLSPIWTILCKLLCLCHF